MATTKHRATDDGAPTSLYRFYDEAGRLLYVGITARGRVRWHDHAADKHWWPNVVGSTVEHFPTRVEALEAEKAAIIAEHPLHNVQHNHRDDQAIKLRIFCDGCGHEIDDGKGILECNRYAAMAAREAWDAGGEGSHPGWRIFTGGEMARIADLEPRWHAWHKDCDPDPEADTYWFDVATIRTLPQVLTWTAHLLEKGWIGCTNWDDVIRRIAETNTVGQVRQLAPSTAEI